MQKSFFGYRRDNGRVGIRNHVLILPLDDLSQPACNAVANNIGGTVAIQHPYGRLQFGADLDLHFRTLIGAGSNPTEEQYAAILDFVATRTQEIGDAMKAGIITPAPYRDGQRTPCSYCSYRSLCRHSYGEAPRWRKLKKIDKADFWESITPKQPPETE